MMADSEEITPNPAVDSTSKEAEEKAIEVASIAKELAEQAALPYSFKQTLLDVDITLSIPAGLRGRDLNVSIGKNALTVGVKGKEPIMSGALCKSIKYIKFKGLMTAELMILRGCWMDKS
jgi:hypothetical protein